MSYRRKIVCLAKKSGTVLHAETVKHYKFSEGHRRDVTFKTVYGWRLSCMHVIHGARGANKTAVDCPICEWRDNPTLANEDYADFIYGWIDLTKKETKAFMAQRA